MPLAAIDYNDKMSIAAVTGKEEPESREKIVTIGQFIRNPQTNLVDVALITNQDWQSRGIGLFLLQYLIRIASEKNIVGFTADVLASNTPMMKVFSKTGYPIRTHLESGVCEIVLTFGDEQSENV